MHRSTKQVTVITFLVLTTRAYASGAPEVRWEAPESCPGEREVRNAIAGAFAQSIDELDPGSIEVEARVKAESIGFSLDLTLKSPSGNSTKHLAAESCETLVRAIAVNVALAASPHNALKPSPHFATPVSRPINFGTRLTTGVALGQLPDFAFAAILAGWAELELWRLEMGLEYFFPRVTEYPEPRGVGGELYLVSALARICLRSALSATETPIMPICGGVEIGLLRGEGRGGREQSTASQLWSAVVLGPALGWPLGGAFWIWTEANLLIALQRPSFGIRGLPFLYRPDLIAARIQVGVEMKL
jgi:hypothetical protein